MTSIFNPQLLELGRKTIPSSIPMNRMMTEINRKLSSGVDAQKMLDFVFDSLDFIIPYDRIGIAILEGVGEEAKLNLKWVRSKIPVTHLNVSYSAPIKGSSLKKILDTNQPRVINDLIRYSAEHPESGSTKLVIKDGIRSNLTCPLRSENHPVGVVFFSSTVPNTYENEHVKIFLEIADELSMIVEHGRLKGDSVTYAQQKQNLSMILHDLKSPLSTIQSFAEMSIGEPWFENIDPEGKKVFQVFLRNSRYMFKLLNSLQELSRLNSSADQISSQEIELRAFAKEMINFGKVLAEAKDIEFDSDIETNIPNTAMFDHHKIQRVLDNLFSNAVKYSARGSKIEFSISFQSDHLIFLVRDHGLGIPADELHLLFHEFGKTSVRPTENEESTGLGLAISKKIVEQHGGEISVESCPSKGSSFSFWIPVKTC